MKCNVKQHTTLGLAWIGALLGVTGEAHSPKLALLGVCCAILASIATATKMLVEAWRLRIAGALDKQIMCKQCQEGVVPDVCPYGHDLARCETLVRLRKGKQ